MVTVRTPFASDRNHYEITIVVFLPVNFPRSTKPQYLRADRNQQSDRIPRIRVCIFRNACIANNPFCNLPGVVFDFVPATDISGSYSAIWRFGNLAIWQFGNWFRFNRIGDVTVELVAEESELVGRWGTEGVVVRVCGHTHGIVVVPKYVGRWLGTVPDDAGEVDGASAINEQLRPAHYLRVWLWKTTHTHTSNGAHQ